LAAQQDQTGIISLLIEKGAQIDPTNAFIIAFIMSAVENQGDTSSLRRESWTH
jgi:hypothetical protein